MSAPTSLNTTVPVAQSQQSPHAAAEAARAMEHTNSWTPPAFERRQSWKQEDQKRELQMSHINERVKTGPGFTERTNPAFMAWYGLEQHKTVTMQVAPGGTASRFE
ncbi:hypothetical protein VDGL01_07935 [Verticillium dahliae]